MGKQLIKEVQRKLRRRWGPLAVVILLLVLLQTIFGQYAGIEWETWLWLLVTLLPVTVLLYGAQWFNPYPARMVEPATARAYGGLVLVYLGLVLVTLLLSQAAVNANDWGLRDYLLRSLWWLLPANLLTIGGLADLLLRRGEGKVPTGDTIAREAAERADELSEEKYPVRKRVLLRISEDQIPAALDALEQHLAQGSDTAMQNQLAIRKGEYQRLVQAIEREVIDPAEAQRQMNRIALALLQMSMQLMI